MTKALLFLFAFSIMASAKTFYISPNGNNADSGTASAPRKTIAYGIKLIRAGDTLMFRGGTYREELKLDRTGTEGAPMTFMAAPGESVFIKGSDTVSGWISAGNGVWNRPNWSINSQQVFVDGGPLQQIGVNCKYWNLRSYGTDTILKPVGRGLEDLIPGSFYYDSLGKTLSVMLKDKSDPNLRKMEASVRGRTLGIYALKPSFIHLRNLNFLHGNGSIGGFSAIVWTGEGANWLIDSCSFTYADFAGIAMQGENHVVRNSRFENNGNVGFSMNGSDLAHGGWYADRPRQNILLENLVFTGNNYRNFSRNHSAGGIKCVPACRGITVRNCNASNNNGAGIWFDHCHGEITIENNRVQNNRGQGIFYEISGPTGDDAFGAKIRNNLVTGSGTQGLYISASRHAIVSNNTLWKNWAGMVLHGMPRDAFQLRDNRITNNIISECTLADMILYAGTGSGTNSLDSNFYHNPVKLKFSIVSGPGYAITDSSISQLRTKGQEAHGASGDPLFNNPASNDFCLASTSPASGKGWTGDCATTEIAGASPFVSRSTGTDFKLAVVSSGVVFSIHSEAAGLQITVFNALGRKVWEHTPTALDKRNATVKWNAGLRNGVYTAVLKGSTFRTAKKFVVLAR